MIQKNLVLQKMITGIFLLIIFYLFIMNLLSTSFYEIDLNGRSGRFYFQKDFPIIHLLFLFIFFSLIYIYRNKIQNTLDNKLGSIITVSFLLKLFLVISLFWIVVTRVEPMHDQKNILLAASGMREFNFMSFMPGNYMDVCTNQQGIVMLFYCISFLTGINNYLAIQIINVISYVCVLYYIVKIGRELKWVKKGGALERVLLCSSFCFLPLFLMITYVYGELMGLALSMIAIHNLLKFYKSYSIKQGSLSVFCMVFACLIKMNYFIILIAIVILTCLKLFKTNRKKVFIIYLLSLFCFQFLMNGVVEYSIHKITGITQSEGIPPEAYIAMGMQEGKIGPGWYNAYNRTVYLENSTDRDLSAIQARADIEKRVSGFVNNPREFLDFYVRKLATQWNEPMFRSNEFCGEQIANTVFGYLSWGSISKVFDYLRTVLLAGVLFWCILGGFRGENEELIFAIIFIGGFLFHIIWEAASRYSIPYYILLLPYSVKGYQLSFKIVDEIRGKKKWEWKENKKGMAMAVFFLVFGVVISIVIGRVLLVTQADEIEAISSSDKIQLTKGYYVISPYDDETMQIDETADGTALLGNGEQVVYSFYKKDGWVIRSSKTQFCLELYGDNKVSWQQTESPFEWRILSAEDGGYYLLVNDYMALTYNINDWSLSLSEFTGSNQQRWQIISR